jgi:hypothetical protein
MFAGLRAIAPRTVIWLNEAQRYLTPDSLGEKVAAALQGMELPPDDWLPKALEYVRRSCKGVLGPLSLIRPRPHTGQWPCLKV